MLIALAVLAALETAAPPAVELTRSGAAAAPVSAAPRTLSDVAREMREGRRAAGGFSAVETTVSREPLLLPSFEWEEETRREPEVVPEPQPGGEAPYVSGWGGWYGGAGGTPQRRPAHPSHFTHPSARPAPAAGRGPSPRTGAAAIPRPAAHASGLTMRGAPRRP